MSFGSSIRFEVKDGGKGGIFWQKEKPKQNQRKTKELRHPVRKPEPEYVEELPPKPLPGKDFIKRNRNQYKPVKKDDDKENHTASAQIKPGTVTLTQEQLNALLQTVDAANNRLQVETPKDNDDSAPPSGRSDDGSEGSVDQELRHSNEKERSSSGYGSHEEKFGGGKGVRFDSARNVEHQRTPDPPPSSIPPPLVPWKHMTVAERKRLQWAREKAAEEELQKQVKSDPWGRPGAGAPRQKPDDDADKQFKTKKEATLRETIDNIQAKYADFLQSPETEKRRDKKSSGGIAGLDSYDGDDLQSKKDRKREGKSKSKRRDKEKSESSGIPGLDDYMVESDRQENSKSKKQMEDRGNSRPKKPDRDPRHKSDREMDEREFKSSQQKEEDRERQSKGDKKKRDNRERNEEKERREEERREEDRLPAIRQQEHRTIPASSPSSETYQPPAAMQTSLFLGQAEPDNSRFISKKELERKQWLDELNRQREEQRMKKQKEKEKDKGLDDTWADRFVAEPARISVRKQQPAPASGGDNDRSGMQETRTSNTEPEQGAMPPAAMRSAMAIGDTAPNMEKIEHKQTEEKRQWLEELNKQREEQQDARMRLKDKQRASEDTWADRFTHNTHDGPVGGVSPHNAPAPGTSGYQDYSTNRVNSAPQPAVDASWDESKTFLRGQNIQIDALTKRELEDKRRRQLEYQAEVKAQIEEKERQKREEREKKWKEEMEEERKLQTERDNLKRQIELEDSKKRQSEEARQRQVEHLKTMMDAEQERAQEERMNKCLVALKQAGHDVSHLKAHYDAITPRHHQQGGIDPRLIPGLMPSPREQQSLYHSSRTNPSTYRPAETQVVQRSQEVSTHHLRHEPYVENRTLTPSRYRHPSQPYSDPSSPLREFATQTDDLLELSAGLIRVPSEVEIEYRGENTHKTENTKGSKKVRAQSANRKEPTDKTASKPPATKQTKSTKHPLKGKPAKWNYQNQQRKPPIKQSEKDPFYEQKRQRSEERRAVRERHLQYLQELNRQVIPTDHQHPISHRHEDDKVDQELLTDRRGVGDGRKTGLTNGDVSHRSQSPPLNRSKGRYRPADRSRSPPVASVHDKKVHNASQDFETDYDPDTHNYNRGRGRKHGGFTPTLDERGNIHMPNKETDFIPFTRTTDILDPSKAEDPLHLSRENTRIKQARQHYHENLRPADYGNQLAVYNDKQRQPAGRHKDPILNPALVKDHPTARQDQILQQLSTLKQSLMQRQRELETYMLPSDLEKQV